MMASDVDVVRVTESQLREIADKRHEYKSKTSLKENTMQQSQDKSGRDGRKKRESKRPAMAFYQPGVSRLSSRKGESSGTSPPDERDRNETTPARTEAVADERRDSRENVTVSVESEPGKSPGDKGAAKPLYVRKVRSEPAKSSQEKTGTSPQSQSDAKPTVDSQDRKDGRRSKKPDRVLYSVRNREGPHHEHKEDVSEERQDQAPAKKAAPAKAKGQQDFQKRTKPDQDKTQPRKTSPPAQAGEKERDGRKVAMDPVGEITITLSSVDVSDQDRAPDHSGKKSGKRYSRNKHERYRTESTGSDLSLNSNEDSFSIPHHEDWEAEMMDVGPPLMGTWENQRRERAGPKRRAAGGRRHAKHGANDLAYDGQTYIIQRTENWEEDIADVGDQQREAKPRHTTDRNQGAHHKTREEGFNKTQQSSPRAKEPPSTNLKDQRRGDRGRHERREDRPARDRQSSSRDKREEKQSVQKETSHDDHRKGRLNVTFNEHVREVKVPAGEERTGKTRPLNIRERKEPKSHARDVPRSLRNDHEESLKGTSPTARGGGIIHLPHNVHLSSSPTSDGHTHRRTHPEHSRGYRGRGRPHDHSRLWDPSKQQQPKAAGNRPSPPQLQFHDPEFDRNYSRESEFQHSPGTYHHRGEYFPDFPPLGREQPYQESGYPDRRYTHPPTYPNRGQHPYPYYEPGYGYPAGEGDRDRSWGEQVDRSAPLYSPPPVSSPSFQDHAKTHFSDREDDAVLQNVKARNQGSALRLLNQAKPLEIQLSNILSRRFHGTESMDAVFRLRMELEQVYEGIVLLDVQIADQRRVELQLWKNAYHQVIESFRKQLQDEESDHVELKEQLLKLLDQGTTFYESLLNKLQETYHFKLSELTEVQPIQSMATRSVTRKLAIIHAQKCMIYLGDLARYKEQTNETSNYGRARSWYLKAQQIAPKNGKPYNQLAILAVYTRRKLDAVYYYMRSLASSNPFGSARESLMTLFEEARRKAEHSEKKRKEEELQQRPHNKRMNKNLRDDDMPLRVDVWYTHDGRIESEESNTCDDAQDASGLGKLSPVELNKRFVLSFLHIHGKLFTKIGMERFPEVAHSMLQEFQALLEHSPSPLGNTRLLQLMTINMFAVHNTALRDPVSDSVRSFIQEQAIQLGLDMFGLMVARCVQLLKENDNNFDNKTGVLGEDLHDYLPGIKIWADWMMCHPQLWNPPPDCSAPEHSVSLDVWHSLAQLFNSLKDVQISRVTVLPDPKEGYDLVVLPEDVMLSGFVPLLSLPMDASYVEKQIDKVLAEDCVRISQLLMFGEYLCGQESPLLAYSVEKKCYVSIAPTRAQSEKIDIEKDLSSSLSQEEDDVIIESSADEDFEDDGDMRNIKKLKAQKDALERRAKEEKRRKEHIQAVVESHTKARPFRLEVRPVYIVPDTNCFIDHLKGIQIVVDSRKYTLIVPLVVINELDGLAKGSREGQYLHAAHANRVQQGARAAVNYLEGEFELYNNRIRAVTSRGSVLDTIAFRSEDPQGKTGNNDDVILSCCMFYCEDKAQSFMPQKKDDPILLKREVVLLTDDRNLRVKAYTRTVPTRSIPEFIRKAKLVKR